MKKIIGIASMVLAAAAPQAGAQGYPNKDRKSTRLNSSHTVIYPRSLHDALPISIIFHRGASHEKNNRHCLDGARRRRAPGGGAGLPEQRSEEHTSELQSHSDLSSFPTRRSSDLNNLSQRSFT